VMRTTGIEPLPSLLVRSFSRLLFFFLFFPPFLPFVFFFWTPWSVDGHACLHHGSMMILSLSLSPFPILVLKTMSLVSQQVRDNRSLLCWCGVSSAHARRREKDVREEREGGGSLTLSIFVPSASRRDTCKDAFFFSFPVSLLFRAVYHVGRRRRRNGQSANRANH
jgi:hypothetical protein